MFIIIIINWSSQTAVRALQPCNRAANQLRDADARDQERVTYDTIRYDNNAILTCVRNLT